MLFPDYDQKLQAGHVSRGIENASEGRVPDAFQIPT
jgi:hypothetical protein